MKITVLCLALISIVHADSPCGDDTWIPYEDEKCVKLFQTFANRDQAEDICNKEPTITSVPTLVTIRSAAEQKFLSELVFNSSDSNNVWIGAQRRPDSSTEFDWLDGSAVQRYTNWAVGRPSDNVNRPCVHMQSELLRQIHDMEWADVGCTFGNSFICEKLQSWPIQKFQRAILDARREKEDLRNELDIAKIELKDLQDDFTSQMTNVSNHLSIANSERRNLQDNPIPIGFIYVQLQNQPDPRTLWTRVTWSEITSSYAGLFFRAVGGGSAAFGTIQAENSPRLTQVVSGSASIRETSSVVIPGTWSPYISSGATFTVGASHWMLHFLVSTGEVRPRNSAIRIWIRTA